MIYFDSFTDRKELETFTYNFEVNSNEDISIYLGEGCFEHVLVQIIDPQQIIRCQFTFKTRIRHYVISEDRTKTSNCALYGKITYGTWTMQVIKPSLKAKGKFLIMINSEIYNNALTNYTEQIIKWQAGDLHLHSYFSDGRVSLEQINAYAQECKLDFYTVMDHSIINTKLLDNKNIPLLGTEITLDNDMHYNVYGLDDYIDYYKYFNNELSKSDCLNNMFKDLAVKNILSINHPFAEGISQNHDFDLSYFSLIEVINSPYNTVEEIDNESTLKFFDFLWLNGVYLFGIGGSDAHKKNLYNSYPIGRPTTHIYTKLLKNNMLQALKTGKIYISDVVKFNLNIEGQDNEPILPGSRYNGTVSFYITSNELCKFIFIKNGNILKEVTSNKINEFFMIEKNDYIRIEAYDLNDNIVLFINPIHDIDISKNKNIYFQDLLSKFKSR